jgi:hypothetical protein
VNGFWSMGLRSIPGTLGLGSLGRMSTPAAAAYWARFIRKTRLENGRYVVASFGDSAALADELLGLVLAGPKRATASLALISTSRQRPVSSRR